MKEIKVINILYIAIVLLLLMLTSCSFLEDDYYELVDGGIEDRLVEENKTEEILKSPLSGLEINEDIQGKRPIAIMIDNHNRARWQSGLQDAELVYEYRVEGIYTRYMAVYLSKIPKKVGPVRSARPYFVTKALEMDALYVHVGGSPQAKKDIQTFSIADIDGLNSPSKVFWRENHKRAPNNLYTDINVLKEEGDRRGYRDWTDKTYFKFKDKDGEINGDLCREIKINYLKPNTTSYIYDSENKNYIRYKDGKLHLEELTGEPIRVKNIIIQEAPTSVIDNDGRLSIYTIGEGYGKYISNGQVIDIQWFKDTKSSTTIYKDLSGNEIELNPGNTWVQVVDLNPDIEILAKEV